MMSGVDLHWLPLGAGGWLRVNGGVCEAREAAIRRCSRYDLPFRARSGRPERSISIEETPVADDRGGQRGLVAKGAWVAGRRHRGEAVLDLYDLTRPSMSAWTGSRRISSPWRVIRSVRRPTAVTPRTPCWHAKVIDRGRP